MEPEPWRFQRSRKGGSRQGWLLVISVLCDKEEAGLQQEQEGLGEGDGSLSSPLVAPAWNCGLHLANK